MAKVGNLVQETTVTTGTGNLTVASVNGKRTFNTEFGTGGTDLFYYFVSHQSAAEWEVGTGHLSAATTLVRDTVIASSNANALVIFTAGTKDVVNDLPAVNQMSGLNTGTAAITVGNSDFGKTVELTGSTSRTFAFTAAATLGDGWWCRIVNSSSAEITLDPSGAELIDGLANYKMYRGECRMVRCSGTAFTSVVLHPFYLTVAQAGSPLTFTKPPGYTAFGVRLGGSGGSGGAGGVNSPGGGGGGGATLEASILASAVGTTETITVAAGGTAVTTNIIGNAGGSTSFGSLAVTYGGGAGNGNGTNDGGGGGGGQRSVGGNAPASTSGGTGGTPIAAAAAGAGAVGGTSIFGGGGGGGAGAGGASGGESVWGGGGGAGANTGSSATNIGGKSIYGGGGGGAGGGTTAGGAGGTSIFGGNGGAGVIDANTAVSGSAGTNGYAGGGGGGSETGTSGAGGNGSAAIWGIA